jgi:hypothetical protein
MSRQFRGTGRSTQAVRPSQGGKLLAGEVPTLTALLAQITNLTAPPAGRAAFARHLVLARRQPLLRRPRAG